MFLISQPPIVPSLSFFPLCFRGRLISQCHHQIAPTAAQRFPARPPFQMFCATGEPKTLVLTSGTCSGSRPIFCYRRAHSSGLLLGEGIVFERRLVSLFGTQRTARAASKVTHVLSGDCTDDMQSHGHMPFDRFCERNMVDRCTSTSKTRRYRSFNAQHFKPAESNHGTFLKKGEACQLSVGCGVQASRWSRSLHAKHSLFFLPQ